MISLSSIKSQHIMMSLAIAYQREIKTYDDHWHRYNIWQEGNIPSNLNYPVPTDSNQSNGLSQIYSISNLSSKIQLSVSLQSGACLQSIE